MSKSIRSEILSNRFLYKNLFGQILSKDEGLDAEDISNASLRILEQLSLRKNWPLINNLLTKLRDELTREDNRLEQTLFGCKFSNPIGLAAGFDKNGIAASIWHVFGFGFAEIGTVTLKPQPGNVRPRLFRLAKEKAALNRMGFNNQGAMVIKNILIKQNLLDRKNRPITIGLNFGKSKTTPLIDAAEDYENSLKLLLPFADYAVINVSSPNTPGLRDLQKSFELKKIISKLKCIPNCPPLLIKIAPDLNLEDLDLVASLAYEEKLGGIIAVNTSINRLGLENRVIKSTGLTLKEESGGLSGRPLRKKGVEVIKRLRKQTKGKVPLIGVGGIDSPESAWERITAGASLLQIYTGWIYEGPSLVPDLLEGLSRQLDCHKLKNISEAIGTEAEWI